MSWVEQHQLRRRNSRVWRDSANPLKHHAHCTLAWLHYPLAGPDSTDTDGEVDCTPVRVDNAQMDGWRITANGWHYALGIDKAVSTTQDGWVGFGGRQGKHWFKFRLFRVGYLHWPSRAWQGLGNAAGTTDLAPDYDRANLTRTVQTKTIGPAGATQVLNLQCTAQWVGIWTTPGGGRLDIRWRATARELKEEIIINQAAREWIAANRPPLTPASETWFGLVFRLDLSDVPKFWRGGVSQDLSTVDADDDAGDWKATDAGDRLLAFLPLDRAASDPRTVSGHPNARTFIPLRKRLWKDGDGNHYLLIGAKVLDLNGLLVGGITFDPTFTVAETNEDAGGAGLDEFTTPAGAPVFGVAYVGAGTYGSGEVDEMAAIWRSTGIVQGSTIDSATVVLTDNGDASGTVSGAWWGFAVDSPADFSSAHSAHLVSDHETRTTASVTDNFAGGTAGTHTSPSLVSVLQEIVDRAGFSGDVGLTWRDTGAGNWYAWKDYTDSATDAPDLVVSWTEPSAPVTTFRHSWAKFPKDPIRARALYEKAVP